MEYTYTQLELPLLETMQELGGQAPVRKIYDRLAEKMEISEAERKKKIDKSPTHRQWDRMVRWVRQNLKQSGYISGNKRGVWELTEKAKSFLINAKPGVFITVYEVIDEKGDPVGIACWGEASAARGLIEDDSINLILTSPPYPLLSPKDYGNESEEKYINWFLPIAKQLYSSLKNDGSLVLNLGAVFKKGLPVRSLYAHKLLIALCEDIGFYLPDEFYWENRGKLPTSNWVTIQRIRVKCSIENLFWLSKTPYPKASNLKVLEPYTDKYKETLKKGGYGEYVRPSGHKIDHFNKDNGGKIPSNLITANQVSNEKYIKYCKDNNMPIHPARFPSGIPEFFIKFLTDEGDIVWDPMAGSAKVGEICNKLNRRFIVNDKSLVYLKGSMGRFDKNQVREHIA